MTHSSIIDNQQWLVVINQKLLHISYGRTDEIDDMVHTICGHEESGGVYTRVQPYVSWINSVMGAPITSGGYSDSLHSTSSTT